MFKKEIDEQIRKPNRINGFKTKLNQVKIRSGSGLKIRSLLPVRQYKDAMGPIAKGLLPFQSNPMDTFQPGNIVAVINHDIAYPHYTQRTNTVNVPGVGLNGEQVVRQVPVTTDEGRIFDPTVHGLATADQQRFGIVTGTKGSDGLEILDLARPGGRIIEASRQMYQRSRGPQYDGSGGREFNDGLLEFGLGREAAPWMNQADYGKIEGFSREAADKEASRSVQGMLARHVMGGIVRRSTAPFIPRDVTRKLIGVGQAVRVTLPAIASIAYTGEVRGRLRNDESVEIGGRKYKNLLQITRFRKATGLELPNILNMQNQIADPDTRQFATDFFGDLQERGLGISRNGDVQNPRNLVLTRKGKLYLPEMEEPEGSYRHEDLIGEAKKERDDRTSEVFGDKAKYAGIVNNLNARAKSVWGRPMRDDELHSSLDAIQKYGNFTAGLAVHSTHPEGSLMDEGDEDEE